MIRTLLACCVVAVIVLSHPAVAMAGQPRAVRQRRITPVTIPDVARDQVIGFCLYTVQDNSLKLTAQLYPLKEGESRQVELDIERNGNWQKTADAKVHEEGWMATFRVEKWDHSKNHRYRVRHAGGSSYEGIIRRDPVDKEEIVVAAFTGNSNTDRGPREDIIANLKHQDPDLLFFSGDQSYDHDEHTAAWLLFGRQFGEIVRDRPTITIPDDHDVGHPNLWGEDGVHATRGDGADGGYHKPVDYVNMVQRAQTSHLPDPVDPTPIQRGITVYYTSMNVGGIDFAILEDRKWKSGPDGLVPQMGPRPDHINDPNYDRDAIDVPEAQLLGQRQLKFLREWGQDWTGADMKAVLSQTIFAGGAHLHGPKQERVLADLDSNGWPQSGRNAALREIRRSFAFMIGGDQHLATIIHHGVNDWEDAGVSFCVPSIVNFYGRWWSPLEEPIDHDPKSPLPSTGRYRDGFGNKITMHAYANPAEDNDEAAGYGLVRFRKPSRKIVIECWPRHVDVTQPDAKQFPGWPRTFDQQDNYARKPIAWLPKLEISGQDDPIVQVIDEQSGEIVYTLRISGNTFRPGVFKAGRYTIKIGEGERQKTIEGVETIQSDDPEVRKLEL